MNIRRALDTLATRHPGRRAFITGAGSGLGRALALRLGRDGWTLGLNDIDPAALAQVAAGDRGRVRLVRVRRGRRRRLRGRRRRVHRRPRPPGPAVQQRRHRLRRPVPRHAAGTLAGGAGREPDGRRPRHPRLPARHGPPGLRPCRQRRQRRRLARPAQVLRLLRLQGGPRRAVRGAAGGACRHRRGRDPEDDDLLPRRSHRRTHPRQRRHPPPGPGPGGSRPRSTPRAPPTACWPTWPGGASTRCIPPRPACYGRSSATPPAYTSASCRPCSRGWSAGSGSARHQGRRCPRRPWMPTPSRVSEDCRRRRIASPREDRNRTCGSLPWLKDAPGSAPQRPQRCAAGGPGG